MFSPITKEGIFLRYSETVVADINHVIDQNLDKTALLALFISRLIKGLQNLTNSDLQVNTSWGSHSYEIEDIGIVSFEVFTDVSSGNLYIAVNSICWTFSSSRFFSAFEY